MGSSQDLGDGPPWWPPAHVSTVLRVLRDEGLLLGPHISGSGGGSPQSARRRSATADRAQSGVAVDFSEYETSRGGTWRTAGVADYWSKYEFGWHWSATANQHDAVAGVELAIAEATRLLGGSLLEAVTDAQTGEVSPVVLVTDNGGPFRSFRFAAFTAAHPELRHVRTKVNTPGQNGVRERAFESLKYERLYREDILDVLDLTGHAEESGSSSTRSDHTRRCLGTGRWRYISASPTRPSPPLNEPKSCHFLDAGHGLGRGAKREAEGRLVEGQITTSWKQALAQLALVYPDRINPYL